MKYLLILIILSGCNPHHHTTEKGLDCVHEWLYPGVSCNWDEYNYNYDTNYGRLPYAEKEKG